MKLPDEISNEDYVVDSDEIMEDVTQETNAENDKDQQEIEKMENLLQEMYETDFMSLQLEEKQTQLAGKRKKLHDEAFMVFLAHAGDAKAYLMSSIRHALLLACLGRATSLLETATNSWGMAFPNAR